MSETAEWGNVCSRVDTCALTGAAAFFTGIKGAEVLVNGPLWCYFYALRHLEKSNSRLGERFHGSAAGYGSSFPLNREMTTRLLGFDSMNYNGDDDREKAVALMYKGRLLAEMDDEKS